MRALKAFAPELAVAAAAVLYGSTFTIVQDALDDTTPSGFNLLRFGLAAAVLAPFVWRRGVRGPGARRSDGPRSLLVAGGAVGAAGALAYLTQNIGLEHTTTSNSAFISGLFAVFTPLIELVVYRHRPERSIAVAVVLAVLGLYLLTGAEPTVGFGDAITLVAAACFGAWFVLIGAFASRFDVVALTAVQTATIAVLSAAVVVVAGMGELTASVVLAVAFTGVGCSAVAFSLTTWAQRRIDPSRTSVLSLLEPLVAGLVGYAVGERLGLVGYLGAATILAGILVAESPRWRLVATQPPAGYEP